MLAAALLSSCAPRNRLAQPMTLEESRDDVATCKVAKDPLNPLIVEWPGTEKVALESRAQGGVVVVSYVGCYLKVLPGCQADGEYTFARTTAARDRFEIDSQMDLYARLPLGAASLKGELGQDRRLVLEYVAVGQRVAKGAPTKLGGTCEGATHYVRSMTVGAFHLDAQSKASAGAGVELAGAGGGARTSGAERRLRAAGEIEACLRSPEAPECRSVLQLGLASLEASAPVQGAGFGAGIQPIATLAPVREVNITPPKGGLDEAPPPELYKLLQTAKRADKDASKAWREKARAWQAVEEWRGGFNPFRETAEKVQVEYLRRDEAERTPRAQIRTLQAKHAQDKARLDAYLALDDDVMPASQKTAYRQEFDRAYAPYARELFGEMVEVPAGDFWMGCNDRVDTECFDDEKPGRKASTGAFLIDRTEVSVEAYARCVTAGACPAPDTGGSCTWGARGLESHPVNCVDWMQAGAFCRWAGKRLPTEPEWEKAARGTDGRKFPWGNTMMSGAANLSGAEDGYEHTSPAGTFTAGASLYGAIDMAGNVWEWVSGGSQQSRVLRGGSWFNAPRDARASLRLWHAPGFRNDFVGFRCARSP